MLWCTSGIAEFWSLTLDERKLLLEIAIEEGRAANPDVVVQACTAAMSAKDCLGLTQHAQQAGADIVYIQTPMMVTERAIAEDTTDRCTVCAYSELEAMPEEVRRVSVSDPVAEPVAASDPVLYEVHDSGVAVLTLNRPERMNAWGGGLAGAFYARLDEADADPAVRAIVVTGSGRAFCAGADIGDLSTINNTTVDSAGGTDVDKLVGERHPHFVTTLCKPVIAAINGACAGIGLTQALMCDVRFAAAGAKFTTSFARRGLIAEYGISWILPRVVGWGAALDLLLSGRVFHADEAAALGLVAEVVAPEDLLPRAIGYAEDIAANCAPSSLAVIKQQVYADIMRDVFDASAHAEKLMGESMQRPDFIEGITSFFEKRPPNFPPLKGPEQ